MNSHLKKDLHQLVDDLPEERIEAAGRLLELLVVESSELPPVKLGE